MTSCWLAGRQPIRRNSAACVSDASSARPGLGSAAVHDLALLLKKFQTPRHAFRTLVFLQLDHIGGVNTLLYTLANGGGVEREVAITVGVAHVDRRPRIDLVSREHVGGESLLRLGHPTFAVTGPTWTELFIS